MKLLRYAVLNIWVWYPDVLIVNVWNCDVFNIRNSVLERQTMVSPNLTHVDVGAVFLAKGKADIDALVQEKRNSIALAMELCLFCTNPSIVSAADLVPLFGFTSAIIFIKTHPYHIWCLTQNPWNTRLSELNPLSFSIGRNPFYGLSQITMLLDRAISEHAPKKPNIINAFVSQADTWALPSEYRHSFGTVQILLRHIYTTEPVTSQFKISNENTRKKQHENQYTRVFMHIWFTDLNTNGFSIWHWSYTISFELTNNEMVKRINSATKTMSVKNKIKHLRAN